MKLVDRLKSFNVGENMVYSLVWIAILLIPMMSSQLMSEKMFDPNKIIISWGKIAPYFLIFIINNNILAPKLLLKHKYWRYSALLVALLIIIFGTIDIIDYRYWQSDVHLRNKASFTDLEWYWNVLLGIFMAGANSMIKLYYLAMETDKRMTELERQNIATQMEYLKYQINPHFLMNTLNNIHAMIDFDSEMAKKSVMDLSRMLRHMLYDSAEERTTLDKEVEFLHNYIELMRIRYIDEVIININTPPEIECRKVILPPLMLIVLIENAFKHGISYNRRSFIDIDITIKSGSLSCTVCNSRHQRTSTTSGSGIGMSNLQKRLELLYGNKYSLTVDKSDEEVYRVNMIIPLTM